MTSFRALRQMTRALRPYTRDFAMLFTLSGARAFAFGVVDPLVFKWLIDDISRRNIRDFVELAGAALVLYTLSRLGIALSARLVQSLKAKISRELTLKLLHTFYDLPYSEVGCQRSGYFTSRIYEEPVHFSDVVESAAQAFEAILTFAGSLTVCIWLSWKMAAILSLLVPGLHFLAKRYGRKITGTTIEERECEARLRENLVRAVESYKTVKIFDLSRVVGAKILTLLSSYLGVIETRVRYSSTFQALSGTYLSYAEMAVFVGAAFEVITGVLTVGGLFGFVSAYEQVV